MQDAIEVMERITDLVMQPVSAESAKQLCQELKLPNWNKKYASNIVFFCVAELAPKCAKMKQRLDDFLDVQFSCPSGNTVTYYVDTKWDQKQLQQYVHEFLTPNGTVRPSTSEPKKVNYDEFVKSAVELRHLLCGDLNAALQDLLGYPDHRDWDCNDQTESWTGYVAQMAAYLQRFDFLDLLDVSFRDRHLILRTIVSSMPDGCCPLISSSSLCRKK